jgi:hypothetical protein
MMMKMRAMATAMVMATQCSMQAKKEASKVLPVCMRLRQQHLRRQQQQTSAAEWWSVGLQTKAPTGNRVMQMMMEGKQAMMREQMGAC